MFCKPQFRRRTGHTIAARMAAGRAPQQYTPLHVAKIYGLPIPSNGGKLDGAGQTIGVIELGGAFYQNDLSAYLRSLGLPDNQVKVVTVNGAQIQPDPGGADVEVMLDVCIIAALAPRAQIRVYFANNTGADFAAAEAQACRECDVVSISWGGPENGWPNSDRAQMDQAIQSGVVAGVSTFVAAGDNGSRDGTNSPVADFPASSPYSIGCGGTNLQPDGTESVWNDGSQGGATGGGFSLYYGKPAYQNAEVSGISRGVPDVCGVADPETGWLIMAGGQLQSVGGTSAVAPMWAAICALLNQAAGKRIGFFNALAYANILWFNDDLTGNNGDYSAGPGWDACTGLGSPKGSTLFAGAVPAPPTPPTPIPVPASGPTLQQVLAIIDGDFAAYAKQRIIIGKIAAEELKPQIENDIAALFAAQTSTKGSDMKENLSISEHNQAAAHAAAIDHVFGLPPGTIINVITQLLPVILGLFGGKGGGATPPAK